MYKIIKNAYMIQVVEKEFIKKTSICRKLKMLNVSFCSSFSVDYFYNQQ